MKKVLSYLVAATLGILCVAPPINYSIPMGSPELFIDGFRWIYLIVIVSLFGFFLMFQKINVILKGLIVYLFMAQFFSMTPAESFNAYILTVGAIYFMILCQKCDYEIIINMLQAVFWFEVMIAILQHYGMDRLLLFGAGFKIDASTGEMVLDKLDDIGKGVYWGTVFQQMRFASLLCILSPFLLVRSKWYLIPITVMAVLLGTLGFTFALGIGVTAYLFLEHKQNRLAWMPLVIAVCLFCAVKSWSHIRVEWVEGRMPIWWVMIKSWCLDTYGPVGKPDLFGISQTGPWNWTSFLFGRGMDTFLPLFPYFKHDPNPFAQGHNDWIQLYWEIGLIGATAVEVYTGWLYNTLARLGLNEELAGCLMISTNMFVAFPIRMTQTVLLMVAWVGYCELRIKMKREAINA